MKICIASCKGFYQKTLPILIPSLYESGFSAEEIVVFIAGYEERKIEYINGIKTIFLAQNSFEYSPLIDIVENDLEEDWWFLLHDTCKAGPQFKNVIINLPSDPAIKTVAIKKWPSMSIGAYRYSYLQECKQKLLAAKNTDYSREELQKWKQWGISHEDYIMGHGSVASYYGDGYEKLPLEDWYDSDITRKPEYYAQVDLYKLKSNWDPKKWMEIDL